MKKKVLALMLVIVMAVSLAACGEAAAPAQSQTQDQAQTQTQTQDPQSNPGGETAKAETTTAAAGEYTAFDAFPHPNVKTDGKLKVGCVVPNLTSESLYRWDWQLQIECAHRGWEYVSFQYNTNDNFEATWQSAINAGCDALIQLNTSSPSWADFYDQAREAGIGVYSTDQGYGGYICGVTSPGAVMMSQLLYRVGADYNWDLDVAIIGNDASQTAQERLAVLYGLFEHNVIPNFNLVVKDEVSAISQALGGVVMAGKSIGDTWMQKYTNGEIQCIFSYGDNGAMGACEAIMQAGKTVDDIFCVGIDGGRQCWSYIRNGDPMKYSYAQGFELQMHSLCNIIEQIQVKGLNPGDPGCDVSTPQSMLFFEGGIVTKENVPDVGTSVHQAFDYYDPTETDPEKAWWNWTDGPGIYMVEGYEKK